MNLADADILENYLRDLSLILTDLYKETSDDSDGFQLGRRMAFREVISVMQQQADLFQIPRDRINLPKEDMD
ncbi:MAG: hypothetical protein J0L50_14970 [Sphingomonadales bacterium]|nr:hypothetical protein [Sphingomonadales bacterium]